MRNTFDIFDSYPINDLADIVNFLSTRDLSCLITSELPWQRSIYFNKARWILFPNYIFNEKNFSEYPNFEELGNKILPLVQFVNRQIHRYLLENYIPWKVEINIMPPNSTIVSHVDKHEGTGVDYRVHLVLYTNENVQFIVDDDIRHFSQGSCFTFDNTRLHSVINSDQYVDRAHLVIDYKLNK